jgi:hypothetical protein
MANHLVVMIPSGHPNLRREIEAGVEEYANVLHAHSYDLGTVKLVLEVVSEGVAIAGGVAGILTFIRSLQAEKEAQGHTLHITVSVPGGEAIPADQADAALLTRLLEEPIEE